MLSSMNSRTFYRELLKVFAPILTHRSFVRGEVIHTVGKACPHLFLVKSGMLRAHYILDGREVTAHFATAGYSITAPDSFIAGRKSRYGLEAVVKAEAYVVEHGALAKFLETYPEHEALTRRFTQALYLELLNRLEGIIFYSAHERYATLLREQPEVLAYAPLVQVSSYLGIAPETLSRVRAQVS